MLVVGALAYLNGDIFGQPLIKLIDDSGSAGGGGWVGSGKELLIFREYGGCSMDG